MYRIWMFDGLFLPEAMQRGDSQDIATDVAVTSITQLPGGGFYDNFGQRTSPAAVTTPVKTCILVGTSQSDLRSKFDALRGKRGKRGRLSVRFGDGHIRWFWARLIRVNANQPETWKGLLMPVWLQWETTAEYAYGITNTSWVWGDGTWHWGDGSTTFGAGNITQTIGALSDTLTVTHDGTAQAKNIRFTITTGGTNGLTSLTILNTANGQQVGYVGTLASGGDVLVIDCGAKSVRKRNQATIAISNIRPVGEGLTINTATAHGRSIDDIVYVSGTSLYNGDYQIEQINSATGFAVRVYRDYAATQETTGAIQYVQNAYADFIAPDRTFWMYFEPGNNTLEIDVSDTGSELKVDYYDHYA